MRIAYLHCHSGISGDMMLGALVDAGLDPDLLKSEIEKVDLHGYSIRAEECMRGGIRGTKVDVITGEGHERRGINEITSLIGRSGLPEEVKEKGLKIFRKLAEAEARVHNVSPEEIHFHEIGAVDSLVDIIGSVIGIHALGIRKIICSPLNLGSGQVKMAHGMLPVPAPATIEVLKGCPVYSTDIPHELTTPTGAAIAATMAEGFGPLPPMTVSAIGCGAVSLDLHHQPNLLRMIIGEEGAGEEGDVVTVMESNVDDMNPEFFEHVMERLMEGGALDCFLTPIFMKKSRPATKLTVIAEPEREDHLSSIILKETTTFGVRSYRVTRRKLKREWETIETPYGKVRVKLGILEDSVIHLSPENEDCLRIANEKGVPIQEVYDAARERARGEIKHIS